MYLLYSILSSTVIFIVFKLFSHFGINRLQAIIINYVVACAAGLVLYERPIAFTEVPGASWFPGALFLGVLFILIFNLMALTTQRSGIAVVSVATKMSVVIPILFGVLYYKDDLGFLKLTGIVLSLLAVYLASMKQKKGLEIKKEHLIFPILVFLGSGLIDASIKYLEDGHISQTDVPIFSAVIFAAAFTVGMFMLIFQAFKPSSVIFGLRSKIYGPVSHWACPIIFRSIFWFRPCAMVGRVLRFFSSIMWGLWYFLPLWGSCCFGKNCS